MASEHTYLYKHVFMAAKRTCTLINTGEKPYIYRIYLFILEKLIHIIGMNLICVDFIDV